jgi:hypothetical protein
VTEDEQEEEPSSQQGLEGGVGRDEEIDGETED